MLTSKQAQWCVLTMLAVGVAPGLAQTLPGAPETNGVSPKTATVYVNGTGTINNLKSESLSVDIASNGDVIVGWEDDGAALSDIESVWTMLGANAESITPATVVTNRSTLGALATLESITTSFLSYYRSDGTSIPGYTGWGPKVKANKFGPGVGMAAMPWEIGLEIPELYNINEDASGPPPDADDFVCVQLMNNDGSPLRLGPVSGTTNLGIVTFADADVQPKGAVRLGGWDYLSSGNVVIVGESRQNDDWALTGQASGRTPVYRVVTPAGVQVKAYSPVSATPDAGNISRNGAAAVTNGFAIRWQGAGGVAHVRLFDNNGNPTTTNLNLAQITGHDEAGGGGDGGSHGISSNGRDAYVLSGDYNLNGTNGVWVTVLNANGTVRWSRDVASDLVLTGVKGSSAAIDESGQVIVVFAASPDPLLMVGVMGRRFDATGKPMGGSFYIGENEVPSLDLPPLAASDPKVAWRNGKVAVAWLTKNYADDPALTSVIAVRYFSTFAPGSIESVGLTRIVADTPLIVPRNDALGNWEPYASVLGTSTFLIEANAFAEGFDQPAPDGRQRYIAALQPAAGGAMKLLEGFYGDNGQVYKADVNASRQNGNPGRIAGDTRPGATTFMLGGEASPHVYNSIFGSDNRWNLGFDRLSDGRYGTVQTFNLDPATLAITPLMKVQDSANGRLTSGAAPGNQITRFGGDIVSLDNGNFVSVVEDRSRQVSPDADAAVATIFAPNGSVVKESFVVAKGDIWANVAPFKGGFAVRAKPQDSTINSRVIYFYDNAGTLKGSIDQTNSLISFDPGRGDGTRLFGHINSPYVYLIGRALNTKVVKVAAFDSRNQKFLASTDANEDAFTGDFDRANGAVDALNRLTVTWVSQPSGYTNQQVAARVLAFNGTNFTTLTKSFFPFVNVNPTNAIRTLQMSVAMTTKQICIAGKGEINLQNKPALGPELNSSTGAPLKELNFYTVFSHPQPAEDPTPSAGGDLRFTSVKLVSGNPAKLHMEWTGGGTLQAKDDLSTGNWTDISGAASPYEVPADSAKRFFRVKQ